MRYRRENQHHSQGQEREKRSQNPVRPRNCRECFKEVKDMEVWLATGYELRAHRRQLPGMGEIREDIQNYRGRGV